MKRLIFVAVAFLVGCNGVGSGANRFLPANPAGIDAAATAPQSIAGPRRGGRTKVHLTMTIPKRHRHDRAASAHPSTISSLTQSVSIAVNGGGASVFNATPSSAACHAGPSGTVCTFVVNAPVGSDTFVIATYSGAGGAGTKLDQGSAVFNVIRGKSNAASVRLGPVVTTTADTGLGSLRYAIGSANPGDTIMLLLPAASTITLSSPLTISNRVSIAGPGVTASARHRGRHANASYTGTTISGGGSQQIFAIQAGATVTISGLILANGNATSTPGGAINNQGTLTLVSDVLTANATNVTAPLAIRAPHPAHVRKTLRHKLHAHPRPAEPAQMRHPHCSDVYQFGGAIYNNATLIVSSTIFDGNTVSSTIASCIYGYGGAIFNDIHGVLASSGNEYTNNAAESGGAVYNYSGYGQATFASDTFDANLGCTAATGCATSGCTTACTSFAQGYGAAIYDGDGPGITVTACVFENNVAGGHTAGSIGDGGALYLEEGTVTITGSSFSSNLAGGGTTNESYGYGGAIYWDGSSAGMRIVNDTFTGNAAGGDDEGEGGAINAYEPITGSGDTFTGNTASGAGSAQITNGGAYGGAIYEDEGLTLTGSTFSGNTATAAYTGEGGAVDADDPTTLTGDTFTTNSAIATGSTAPANTYAYGGAIYADDGLALSQNTFASNKASIAGATATEVDGGAVYSDDSLASFGDKFTSNTATATAGTGPEVYGGAISSYDPMTISSDTFTSNTATGPYDCYGGAVNTQDASTAISNSTFTSNVSNCSGDFGAGGAIYDDAGFALSGSRLSGNSATNAGGGLYNDGTVTVSNSLISGNSVSAAAEYDGGGGIYGDSGLALVNSTVSGNTATVTADSAGGGGIYNNEGMSITGSTISGNSVLGTIAGSGGGGIFSYDTMAMINSTVTGNSSKVDGGGYETYGTYANTLTNVTLFQNSATGSGGNIDNPYTIAMANSIVAGGTAGTGADIANAGTLTSGDYNVIQTAVFGNALAGTTTHNLTANPLLLALSNNGGPTFTNADQSSSPGRADIPFAGGTCNGATGTNVDQRGFARGAGGRCDVGAYEFAGVASSARRPYVPPVRGHHHAPHHPHRAAH